MENKRRTSGWTKLLTVGVAVSALALLITPGARQMFARQLETKTGIKGAHSVLLEPSGSRYETAVLEVGKVAEEMAKANPQDLPLQIAVMQLQIENGEPNLIYSRLRQFQDQYPDRPEAQAAVISAAWSELAKDYRNEGAAGNAQSEADRPLDDKIAELLIRSAKRGEALEPDNAYFTLTRAAVEMNRLNDPMARELLKDAGRKKVYRSYNHSSVEGWRRIGSDGFGDPRGLASIDSLQAPQHGQLIHVRRLTRIAMRQAFEYEQQGNAKEALELRKSVSAAGRVMAYNADSTMAGLTGFSIILSTAESKSNKVRVYSTEESSRAQYQKYVAHLTAIGEQEEARLFSELVTHYDLARTKAQELPTLFEEADFTPTLLVSPAVSYELMAATQLLILFAAFCWLGALVAARYRLRFVLPLVIIAGLTMLGWVIFREAGSLQILAARYLNAMFGAYKYEQLSTPLAYFVLLSTGVAALSLTCVLLSRKPQSFARNLSAACAVSLVLLLSAYTVSAYRFDQADRRWVAEAERYLEMDRPRWE